MTKLLTRYSFDDDLIDWNSPNKTDEQKEIMRSRGHILNMRMDLDLDTKIMFAKRRIETVISKYGEDKCYVSFSGGKDSTILSHIISSMGYNLEHVFSNTRLEYPECINFARQWCKRRKVKLTLVTPQHRPLEIWKKYGYPMFSKEVAEILERVRNHDTVNPKKLKKVKSFMKYKDLHISARCCYYLKKKPLKDWQLKSGKNVAIMGVRAEESQIRRVVWIRKGCIYETKNQIAVHPIIFFRDADIYEYAKRFGIKFADIYYKGFKRNGCFCCGFGCHMVDENNFMKLKKLNPILWKNIMNHWGFEKICKKCDVRIE